MADNKQNEANTKQSDVNTANERQSRMQESYLKARKQQELLEVELNRAKIVMVDVNGKMIRVPLLAEH